MRTFISYCHEDKELYNRLKVHLKSLERVELIEPWSDYEILPGKNIDNEIKKKMEESELFLLLVSPDFIASDYCMGVELKYAVNRHNLNTARVVPIILEDCNWKLIDSISQLKVLPEDAKPVRDTRRHDKAFSKIIIGLERVISDFTKHSGSKNINHNPNYSRISAQNQKIVDNRSTLETALTNTPEGKASFLILQIGNHVNLYKESLYELPSHIEDKIGVSDYSSVLEILKKLNNEGLIVYDIFNSRNRQEFRNFNLTESGRDFYHSLFE